MQELAENERNAQNQGKSGIHAKTSKYEKNPENTSIFNLHKAPPLRTVVQ